MNEKQVLIRHFNNKILTSQFNILSTLMKVIIVQIDQYECKMFFYIDI